MTKHTSAFYSQFCEPKKSISKHIAYFTLPFVHKLQEDVNLNRILNSKAVKSHLPLPAKKFKINVIYIYAILYKFCFLWFTNCVLLSDNSLIPGCLWRLVFVLNNTLILCIWCSTIPHLPGCFCPWTFFQNIGFNMVPSDPFMSHLATQLWYSAGEFQALQLIVLETFGVVD